MMNKKEQQIDQELKQAFKASLDTNVIQMLQLGGIFEPTKDEIQVLADDIEGLQTDEFPNHSYYECVTILLKRIGGSKNVRSYLNCLLVR